MTLWYGLIILVLMIVGIIYIAALPRDARKLGRRRRQSSAGSSDSNIAYFAPHTHKSSNDSDGGSDSGGDSGGGDGGGGGGD